MRLRSILAVATALATACASGGGLRPHAGAPLVARSASAPLKTKGVLLVNPLDCAGFLGIGAGAPPDELGLAIIALGAVITVGCAGVLGAADLVALPVLAVKRHGQAHEIESINTVCSVRDPAPLVGEQLVGTMVQEFGFRAPPEAEATPPDAVVLTVSTADFTRSSRIAWSGSIVFRTPDGKVVWRDYCDVEAPERTAAAFQQDCEAAQAEIDALASSCVERIAKRLRAEWKESSLGL